jgi:hypothetical protein
MVPRADGCMRLRPADVCWNAGKRSSTTVDSRPGPPVSDARCRLPWGTQAIGPNAAAGFGGELAVAARTSH